jgi:hypothetical protein
VDTDSTRREDEALGSELAPVYRALWNEVAWVHLKWEEFVVLFGTKPSRIELLNRAAGGFFRLVQDAFFSDVLLHLCRLTDPPRSMGKDNLTVQRLPSLIADGPLKEAVTLKVEDAVARTAFCRDWRNRHIAHTDLLLALRSGAEPLQSASRTGVKDALATISELLNMISTRLLDTELRFDMGGATHGAASLLYVLDDGLILEATRKQQLKAGIVDPSAYAMRDL